MSTDPALARLMRLDRGRLEVELGRCFGSSRWARQVADRAPFGDRDALLQAMESAWRELPPEEWRAAIHGHPRIGETGAGSRFASTRGWSRDEQAGVAGADPAIRAELARGQAEYEARFGHGFLIFATGKTAEEILAALEERLRHDPQIELEIAARELRKIAFLRLGKLLEELDGGAPLEART